ncbi:MAG: DoxX family protein [Ekhidna sp.]|nr:DoxX family protein [Ekhidna sp.]
MMIASSAMYLINTEEVREVFIGLGYNSRIVIPLAILKISGIIVILTNFSKTLKEWAYFGFLLDFVMALEAHLAAQDNGHFTAIAALALWAISYTYNKKVYA